MSLINEKWEILFEKYNIENEIKKNGLFYITADQIREVKEPRLMTKFDTRESLPGVFGKKIAILPVTRGRYVLGGFDLYQEFPEMVSDIKQMTSAQMYGKRTSIKPEPEVTFIRADSFHKVISFVEHLNESPMTTIEIAELFGFQERQSDYYFNACKSILPIK